MTRWVVRGFKVATWPYWLFRWLEDPIPEEPGGPIPW